MAREKVSIVRSPFPDEHNIYKMVERSIDLIGGLDNIIEPDDYVILKPNLVNARKYFTGATTDPLIISAVIDLLRELGVKKIAIAEGSWVGCLTERAFVATGVQGLAQDKGVELVNLKTDKHAIIKVPKGRELQDVRIAETVLKADKIINLPKMKVHSNTLLSFSLKNLKGCLSDFEKHRFHRIDIHQAIADLNTVLKTDLVVIDGIIGEMEAELGAEPIRLDTILAGKNVVAVDSVAAMLLGYHPQDIRHIVNASKLGLGPCELDEIELVGARELTDQAAKLLESSKLRQEIKGSHQTEKSYFSDYDIKIKDAGACSSCFAALLFAFKRLKESSKLQDLSGNEIVIGQLSKPSKSIKKDRILIGNCLKKYKQKVKCVHIEGCPPSALDILTALERF